MKAGRLKGKAYTQLLHRFVLVSFTQALSGAWDLSRVLSVLKRQLEEPSPFLSLDHLERSASVGHGSGPSSPATSSHHQGAAALLRSRGCFQLAETTGHVWAVCGQAHWLKLYPYNATAAFRELQETQRLLAEPGE